MDTPASIFRTANRLRLHLLEWGGGDDVVLLLHGFLEHAHVWDFVAPRLADAGYRVCALDWRGHGDSQWVGEGGYYHYLDYVADLEQLVPQLAERVSLVAHSMGGGAALLFAGVAPDRVRAVVTIEGLGAVEASADTAPDRVAQWLADLRKAQGRSPSPVDLERAAGRMQARWPTVPPAMALHVMRHATREADGRRWWKFDPLHQTRAPLPTPLAYKLAVWHRVRCPVLYVEGAESSVPVVYGDVGPALAELRAERVTLPGAGHHPHLEQPEALAETVLGFLSRRV